ncbi:hypothetical protein [Andreprevotia chitinilytica]|uniref:hypothetical protein n=1 Tax=Andreprevotia chitinilytica TaxID=396808 RepID=UPI00055681D5|nr:hypothetical protein [Andreprevotia chitinilytica]
MFLNLFFFGGLTAAWWALVWFVLPVDLRRLSVPTLISLHILVPIILMTVVVLWRRWREKRAAVAAQAAIDAQAAEQAARIKAARETHEAELQARRVHLDCRGVWLASTAPVPAWYDDAQPHCIVLESDAAEAQGAGWQPALSAPLQQTFEQLFSATPAAAWLPVYLLPSQKQDGVTQIELVKTAWQAAIANTAVTRAPAQPDCKFLPGSGPIPDRLLALFGNDPGLPAALLLGCDSPLGLAEPADEFSDEPSQAERDYQRWHGKPGQAVAISLFSRPGLATTYADELPASPGADPYQPYWEQQHGREAAQVAWGRVPPVLQAGLLELAPVAALFGAKQLYKADGLGKGNALTRQIQTTLEAALINARLRDLPFDPPPADTEPPTPEIGWLVHNSGGVDCGGGRLAAIASALSYFGCELNPIDEASNLVVEQQDVGAARAALSLAVAAMRVAALQSPVVTADFDGQDTLNVCVLTPAMEASA